MTATPAPAPATKATNPKDAIADTRIPLWLLSPIAKAAWAVAQYAGMTKYGAWNWRVTGVRMSVYLSALQRHIDALISGEWYDPIDGTLHLGNIMAGSAIVLDAWAAGKLIDDRPPSVCLRPAYAEGEATMAYLRAKYIDKRPRHCTIADTDANVAPKPFAFEPSPRYTGPVAPTPRQYLNEDEVTLIDDHTVCLRYETGRAR